LHLGNLRTALAAWLFAKQGGGRFLLRFEDLLTSAVRDEHYQTQADDLAALELEWDEEPIRQSDRLDLYRDAVAKLTDQGLVYPCYCSRKDVREATQAPNGLYRTRHYPGTCRTLSASDLADRVVAGRPPALRFRSNGEIRSFTDLVVGPFSSSLDDFVVQRGDGTPAYNLAATVDDAAQGVELVVRADDLLDSTPRQLVLLDALDLPTPQHAHVPLVLNEDGDRLAKRDGAVTLEDRMALGQSALEVRSLLAASLGLCDPGDQPSIEELLDSFDAKALPREPWSMTRTNIDTSDLGLV